MTSSAEPSAPTRVLLIGLGVIGQTHARALEATPSADVVAGVDVDRSRALTFRGADRPVYPSVRDASEACAPGLVVIATPTGTHAAVCEPAARSFPQARLLVEKPAAASLEDARRILSRIGGRQPVEVAYHTSFAPEVSWGQAALSAGGPSSATWCRPSCSSPIPITTTSTGRRPRSATVGSTPASTR